MEVTAMSTEQLINLIDGLTNEDALKVEAIIPHIAVHDWESAIALINLWAMSDQPEDLTDDIDGRELLNAIRAAFE
jgi:hypothetical protein